MNKVKSAIQFLFNQNKIVIGLAVVLTQFPALADVEFAVMSPFVTQSRAAIGILLIELLACLILLPLMLFAFKVTGRLKQILGAIPAAILFCVAWLITMYFTRTMSEGHPGVFTALFTLEVVLFAFILSLILLLTRGKSTFFEVKSAEAESSHQDTDTPVVSQGGSMFCGQCGSPALSTSKFCAKCGIQLVTA